MLTDLNHIDVIDIPPASHLENFCKKNYENISPLEWSVKLFIVRRLIALKEVLYV